MVDMGNDKTLFKSWRKRKQ